MRPLRLLNEQKATRRRSIKQIKSGLNKMSMMDVINAKQQAQDASDKAEDAAKAAATKGKDVGKAIQKAIKPSTPRKKKIKAPPAAKAPYKPTMTQGETEKEMRLAGKAIQLTHHVSKMNHPELRELAKKMKSILGGYIDDHYEKVT